jgi:hypothetical protein
VKKLIRWPVVIVLVVLVIQNPGGAAHLAHRAMTGISHAAHALTTFASGL